MAEDPEIPIKRSQQVTYVSESTTWRILHKNLTLKTYTGTNDRN